MGKHIAAIEAPCAAGGGEASKPTTPRHRLPVSHVTAKAEDMTNRK
ncbi:hypothetical protein [Methyloglobulus morosus]|nr:hypothetical protein [Methyloglobulus morosus]